jgi:translation initiation factor 2B subunit (eIF-2B alpha/beta/delta family)
MLDWSTILHSSVTLLVVHIVGTILTSLLHIWRIRVTPSTESLKAAMEVLRTYAEFDKVQVSEHKKLKTKVEEVEDTVCKIDKGLADLGLRVERLERRKE